MEVIRQIQRDIPNRHAVLVGGLAAEQGRRQHQLARRQTGNDGSAESIEDPKAGRLSRQARAVRAGSLEIVTVGAGGDREGVYLISARIRIS
jgi:hypothetical protein